MRFPFRSVLAAAPALLLGACTALPLTSWQVDRIDDRIWDWHTALGDHVLLVDFMISSLGSDNTAVQRGTVDRSGELDLPLRSVTGDDLSLISPICLDSDVAIEGVSALFLLFSASTTPATNDDITATALYATSPGVLSGDESGTVVFWFYVPHDTSMKERCGREIDYSYDLDLRTGWNTVLATIDAAGKRVEVVTGVPGRGFSWIVERGREGEGGVRGGVVSVEDLGLLQR